MQKESFQFHKEKNKEYKGSKQKSVANNPKKITYFYIYKNNNYPRYIICCKIIIKNN